jgi:Xaa-Pro aminopeptidase
MIVLINRVAAAREYLESLNLDAFLFTNLSNIRYITGFTGSEGVLVLTREDGWFLTDSRYTTQATAEVSGFRIVDFREKIREVSSALTDCGARRAGFESTDISFALYQSLSAAVPSVELVPVGAEIDLLRIRKDAQELEILASVAEMASSVVLEFLNKITPGVTEKEVALAIEYAMKAAGADDKAFDFIVASGKRGALPHGKATDKKIATGELLTIDFGAVRGGYHSDETITVAIGHADDRQREIYGIVKSAHDLALEAVKPGVTLRELDGKARSYIDEKGFGKYFGHGLGHGVGIDIHEKPVVSFRSEGVVEEGMVFTIEPGIYIPEWGGVRIEDTVCVTGDGCRVLTTVPKELMTL